MNRKDLVLSRVFNVLKDEEVLAKITQTGKLEDGFNIIKEKLEDTTEVEYKEAVEAIKENKGKVIISSDDSVELTDEDLEKVSGGALAFEEGRKLKGIEYEDSDIRSTY